MSQMVARRAAAALLATGAALSLASLSAMVWWKAEFGTAHVEYDQRFSLWSRTSRKHIESPLSHGEACVSSDECAERLWCRHGTRKCMTDGDCRWTSTLRRGTGGSSDCRRIPRSKRHTTWGHMCSASSMEVLPCRTVGLIRTFVAVSAFVALLASPCALCTSRLPSWAAGVSSAFGVTALALALTIDLPIARASGAGVILHALGLVAVAAGCAAAWASRVVVADDAMVDPKFASKYGRNFEMLQEEGDVDPKSRGRIAGVTLLQTLRSVQPYDCEEARRADKAALSPKKPPVAAARDEEAASG